MWPLQSRLCWFHTLAFTYMYECKGSSSSIGKHFFLFSKGRVQEFYSLKNTQSLTASFMKCFLLMNQDQAWVKSLTFNTPFLKKHYHTFYIIYFNVSLFLRTYVNLMFSYLNLILTEAWCKCRIYQLSNTAAAYFRIREVEKRIDKGDPPKSASSISLELLNPFRKDSLN